MTTRSGGLYGALHEYPPVEVVKYLALHFALLNKTKRGQQKSSKIIIFYLELAFQNQTEVSSFI